MKLVKSESKEWLEKQGYSKKIFLEENELGKGSLVQKVKIKIGERTKSHYHEKQTEVFYFLTDNGYFIINGEKIDVNVGDVLVVEPGDRHETVNDSDKDFVFLCFKINFVENDLIWD